MKRSEMIEKIEKAIEDYQWGKCECRISTWGMANEVLRVCESVFSSSIVHATLTAKPGEDGLYYRSIDWEPEYAQK